MACGGQLGAALEHLDLVGQLRRQDLHLVEQDHVDGLVHHVHHVVEAGGERVDVLAVERRDERAVHPLDDRVGRLVGGVLGLAHPAGHVLVVGAVASISASSSAPTTRCWAASVKRS